MYVYLFKKTNAFKPCGLVSECCLKNHALYKRDIFERTSPTQYNRIIIIVTILYHHWRLCKKTITETKYVYRLGSCV